MSGSTSDLKTIAGLAKGASRSSKRRAVISHVTHYTLGIGAAAAAASAGALAAADASDAVAAVAGGAGALFASVLTFMNPLKRAAFHYRLAAGYEELWLRADALAAATPSDDVVAKVREDLRALRVLTPQDLAG